MAQAGKFEKIPKVDLTYVPDRVHVDDSRISLKIKEALKKRGLVNAESNRIHFCGLVLVDSTLTVFLPRNYIGSQEPKERIAYYLLRAIAKFYQTRDTGIVAEDDGEGVTGGQSLSIALVLLEDYMRHGLYVCRKRKLTRNDGKVSWLRTATRSTAFPSGSGPVYLDLCTTRTVYSSDGMTARIHASVIRELLSSFGMLVLGKCELSARELEIAPLPAGTSEAWLTHLRKELQFSYFDRDIFLIRSLISYLEGKKGTVTGQLLIGVNKFQGLWEAMLNECLVGNLRVNDQLPVPAYVNAFGVIELVARKGQRTDTVLRSGDKQHIAIIDAKYYAAVSPQNAPGWPDLVKQFFYQQFIQRLYPTVHISNHFIFPGNTEKNLATVFVAERSSKTNSVADFVAGYGPINCHYQDPLELLRLYASGEKLKKLTEDIFAVGAAAIGCQDNSCT